MRFKRLEEKHSLKIKFMLLYFSLVSHSLFQRVQSKTSEINIILTHVYCFIIVAHFNCTFINFQDSSDNFYYASCLNTSCTTY